MSERLPYEDAFEDRMNDLPMPDEEQAWQKMKALLDEDDRKRRILPPVFFSCALWSVMGLALLAGGWWFLVKEKKDSSATVVTDKNNEKGNSIPQAKKISDRSEQQVTNNSVRKDSNRSALVISKDEVVISHESEMPIDNRTGNSINKEVKSPATVIIKNTKEASKKVSPKMQQRFLASNLKLSKRHSLTSNNIPEADISVSDAMKPVTGNKNKSVATKKLPANRIDDSNKPDSLTNNNDIALAHTNEVTVSIVADSITKRDSSISSDTTIVTQQDANKPQKTTSKSLYAVAVGIGEQQSINTKGQASVPYNYYGRSISLSDYIPSVYVRLQKGKQWFLQGEFRYGAPQSVKEFSFSQQTKYDTLSASLVTTSTRIKKTFYHQIPLSLNYYILPHWSVGVGAMYSLFHGAITEQDVKNKNLLTGAETNTKMIVRVPAYTDSFLYKTQWHMLFQTDYQWKRFSIGLRYQRDLQPFIKYTDPAGVLHAEKNQSFDVFIRFQLWKSKPFHF